MFSRIPLGRRKKRMCSRSGMRTVLTISYLLHYCLWVCFSMLLQQTDKVNWTDSKTMYYAPNASLILFYLLIGDNGEPYLQQFKKICLLSIMSIFIVMILNYQGAVTNTYKLIECFCGLVFVTSLMILISGKRHEAFNE